MRRDRGSGIWFSEAVKNFKGFTHTQYTSGPVTSCVQPFRALQHQVKINKNNS
jgi:hypothetical protein